MENPIFVVVVERNPTPSDWFFAASAEAAGAVIAIGITAAVVRAWRYRKRE